MLKKGFGALIIGVCPIFKAKAPGADFQGLAIK
jgi:hypothetical protein